MIFGHWTVLAWVGTVLAWVGIVQARVGIVQAWVGTVHATVGTLQAWVGIVQAGAEIVQAELVLFKRQLELFKQELELFRQELELFKRRMTNATEGCMNKRGLTSSKRRRIQQAQCLWQQGCVQIPLPSVNYNKSYSVAPSASLSLLLERGITDWL